MINGTQFVDDFLTKPMRTIVGVLVLVVAYLWFFAAQSNILHAEMLKDQVVSDKYHAKQEVMYDMLIRIDENVKILTNK